MGSLKHFRLCPLSSVANKDEFFDAVEDEAELEEINDGADEKKTLKKDVTSLTAKITKLSKQKATLRNRMVGALVDSTHFSQGLFKY